MRLSGLQKQQSEQGAIMKRIDLIIDALELAIKETQHPSLCIDKFDEALAAAHELKALKPVAFIENHKAGQNLSWSQDDLPYAKATPLYTAPPKRGAGGAQSEQRAAWQGNGGAGYNVGGTGVDKPEQEPVAYVDSKTIEWFLKLERGDEAFSISTLTKKPSDYCDVPLYTAPPRKKWVGLDDEDWMNVPDFQKEGCELDAAIYDWIEARLKEKNT